MDTIKLNRTTDARYVRQARRVYSLTDTTNQNKNAIVQTTPAWAKRMVLAEQIVCSQDQRKTIIVALGWCGRDSEDT